MIEIKIEKFDSPIHCIKCGTQTLSSVSKFIKSKQSFATDSILMHNVSCIDKCDCEYGKESYDSHVLKYVENKDSITICPHLIYSGTGIIPFDVNTKDMYCKFFDKLSEIGGDFLQILQEEVDDEHLILNIESPNAPLGRYFVVYNLGDPSKEKNYFDIENDCKYWDVWKPTVEKYLKKSGDQF